MWSKSDKNAVFKMAFLVLMKMYTCSKFCKMTPKTAIFELILNGKATKREHADENLNHISFVT